MLDVSAIATLTRLDAWKNLGDEIELVVSQATHDKFSHWLHQLTEQEGQPSGYSYLTEDGQLTIEDSTAEQLQQRRNEIQAIVDTLDHRCSVKDAVGVSELDPRRREQYIAVCGIDAVQSVCIAKATSTQLWTDDLLVASVAELDFGVERLWTQLVCKSLHSENLVDDETYSTITAKLAAWNYISTIWHPQDLVAAGKACDWDVEAWPLKQCIQLIDTCPLPLSKRARLAMEFFRLLRQSDCIDLRQTSVIRATLNSVGNRGAVEWMLQHVDECFPLDHGSAEFVRIHLQYWLRHG